jgi:hypothetical protein
MGFALRLSSVPKAQREVQVKRAANIVRIVEQPGAPRGLSNRPANEFVAGVISAPRFHLIDRPGDDTPSPRRAQSQAVGPIPDKARALQFGADARMAA